MEGKDLQSKINVHIVRGCLVVIIQTELYDKMLIWIQKDILEKIKKTGLKKVIIDLSGINIIDSFFVQTITNTARMASLLGATTVITGLTPGSVASMIDLGLELLDVRIVRTLELGFDFLESA